MEIISAKLPGYMSRQRASVNYSEAPEEDIHYAFYRSLLGLPMIYEGCRSMREIGPRRIKAGLL